MFDSYHYNIIRINVLKNNLSNKKHEIKVINRLN